MQADGVIDAEDQKAIDAANEAQKQAQQALGCKKIYGEMPSTGRMSSGWAARRRRGALVPVAVAVVCVARYALPAAGTVLADTPHLRVSLARGPLAQVCPCCAPGAHLACPCAVAAARAAGC